MQQGEQSLLKKQLSLKEQGYRFLHMKSLNKFAWIHPSCVKDAIDNGAEDITDLKAENLLNYVED